MCIRDSSSTSARPAAIAARSCLARLGACGTRMPSNCSASGLMPSTSCPWRYLARLATSPSCPVATTRSPGSKRKRDSSGRFTRARHGTEPQVRFFLEQRGQTLDAVRRRHERWMGALDAVSQAIPAGWRRARVNRPELSRFLFEPGDLVVATGQDGLVANLAKYLQGQLVLGAC